MSTPLSLVTSRQRQYVTTGLLTTIAIGVLILLSGCGNKRPQRVPVSGRVLLDGQPLTYGVVRFMPDGARPSQGQLDVEGRFRLTCFDQEDGAVLGRHRVEVMAGEGVSETKMRWHAPKRYADVATSGLMVDITAPTDDIVIQLSSR